MNAGAPARRKAALLRLALGAFVRGPMLRVWYPRALFSLAGNARLALVLAVLAVLLDAENGVPLGIVAIDPW